MKGNIYFRLRFGFLNAINTYSRLKFVCCRGILRIKWVLTEFTITNLILIITCISKTIFRFVCIGNSKGCLLLDKLGLKVNNIAFFSFSDLQINIKKKYKNL